ncbi:MAG: toll/interleukin-1 receptor domain-containing protein [Pseudomonadota bacterium]
MSRISTFICHSSADKIFVRRLKSELERNGVRVWVDEREILVGDSLRETIEYGLEHSDYTVVVLSRTSVIRPWVRKELSAAFALEIDRNKTVILPVLIEDADLPLFLRDKRYADFRYSFEAGLSELLQVFSHKTSAVGLIGLETDSCRITIDIIADDGSLIKYEKVQEHRSLKNDVSTYTEAFSSDGRIDGFEVEPGDVVEHWNEGGTTYVKTKFSHPLQRGESIVRTFRSVWHNSFMSESEYWEERQHHPSRNVEVVVKFPASRHPTNWEAYEREGSIQRETESQPEQIFIEGKLALRLWMPTPRLFASYILRWHW